MLYRAMIMALSLCAVAPQAFAGNYPDHAIRMIVPFAAGGGTDVLARIIADSLNQKWGQPVIVENQPGASGAIGTRAAMNARRLYAVDGVDRRADGGVGRHRQ